MKVRTLFFIIISISLLPVCSAEETAATTEAEQTPSFPYLAQSTADDYIRSGPGTNYYVCGKLGKNDVVKVVAQKYSWSCIVPPEGCFSWISKQYVTIDPTNPSIGVITGTNVRVRAGSADNNPLHSDQVQGQVNDGERIRLMGEEQNDYYKIYPPSFAYLWVSSQYIKPIGDLDEALEAIKTDEETDSNIFAPDIVPDTKDLQQYYALEKLVKAEHAKPLLEQDYSKVKQALELLASNIDAGKAASYAEYMVKRIEGFELACEVTKAVDLQEQNLKQIKENIQKAQQATMAELPNLGKYAAIGKFELSSIYQQAPLKLYTISNTAGQIICYAMPEGTGSQTDLTKFIDKKIGLVGTIEPHPETLSALVRFTEIAELD